MTILQWLMAATLLLPFGAASAATSTAVNVPVTITQSSGSGNDEFVGPFANWINAKTGKRYDGTGPVLCTAAAGNNSSDDTLPLQSCLSALSFTTPNLWLPAGTYLINPGQTTVNAATCSSGSPCSTMTVASGAGIAPGMVAFSSGLPFTGTGSVGNRVTVTSVSGTTIGISPSQTSNITSATIYFALSATTKRYISVIGADPATTTIKWAGSISSPGPLLAMRGSNYAKISRLTLDANSKAAVIIQQSQDVDGYSGGGYFDTGNEYSDLVFQNVGTGFDGGIDFSCGYVMNGNGVLWNGNGCAETSMLRSKFNNGARGIAMGGGGNALDMWVWYSTFTRKGQPLYAPFGNLSAFHSNFINSTGPDVIPGFNGGPMTFAWNYSTGSATRFIDCSGGSGNPLPLVIESNTIVNTGSSDSISCGWQGPFVVLDNTIISKVGATVPVVQVGNTISDILSTGNNYTIGTANTCGTGGAVQSTGRCHAVGDTIGSFSDPGVPTLPGTPPNTGTGGSNTRTIFEIDPATCSPCITTIQNAINSAAAIGNGAVVHLQAGAYLVGGFTVPGNTFIQIIGDGYNTALTSNGGSPMITCGTACKAHFRDFSISGNAYAAASGIKITGADQPGARVFMEQGNSTQNTTANLLVNGLNYTNVELHNSVIVGFPGVPGSNEGVIVHGGTGDNVGQTTIFAGQGSGNNNLFRIADNGHLVVRQFWNDGGGAPTNATLSQASSTGGSLSLAGIAGYIGVLPVGNYYNFTNFSGISALVAVDGYIGSGTPNEVISGTGTGANNLNFGFIGCSINEFSDTTGSDAYELLGPQKVATCGNGGTTSLVSEASRNVSSLGAFLNTTLAPLRAALPTVPGASGDPAMAANVTDARIYRVSTSQCVYGIDVEP